MSEDKLLFDADRNLITMGDRRVVFHCHHYNLFLQRTIEDGLGTQDAERVQVAAAMEATRAMLRSRTPVAAAASVSQQLAQCNRLFGALGFGQANLTHITPQGGRITLTTSHYAVGWKAKWGGAKHPVCYFPLGFWMGALSVAANVAPERLLGRELSCSALDAACCELEVEVL